jgi:hypothetical protein
MADQKITQLTETTTPVLTDILPIVTDPAGSPVTKKVTLNTIITTFKASSSDVTTGSSDLKIVTPKSLKDAGLTIDVDGTFAANSDLKIPSQKASKTYADTKIASSYLDIDGTFASNSDLKVPTQKASKTYADTKIASSYLDTDVTLAANSDSKIATQKATKAYADTKIPNSYLDTDVTLAANSDTKLASQKAVKTYADSLASGDWKSYTAVTPTTGTLDSPSFEITFAGVDLTSIFQLGMKFKITQGTDKFFFLTKKSFSTNTTLTLYGGTDYSLVASGTTAITAVSYSSAKSPFGFPLDPTKWTVEVSDNTSRTQASPVGGTWYNLGSVTISIPIGIWDTHYQVTAGVYKTATTVWNRILTTLSTANNSQSDSDMTAHAALISGTSQDLGVINAMARRKVLVLTAKTSYYLNSSCETSSTTLYNNNDQSKLFIRAVCAYL